MDVDVSAVPCRETDMEPHEIMTSESQERMLAIIEPGHLERVLEICERWEIRATVVGKVTDSKVLRVLDGFDGEVLAEIPAVALHDEAPCYDRASEPVDPAGLLEVALMREDASQVARGDERVWVRGPQRLLSGLQGTAQNGLGLLQLAHVMQQLSDVFGGAERVWVVGPQRLLAGLQGAAQNGFGHL